ncbi:MAG: patatin-like phospholipase family protein [Deltaproteobacteria bacterium]|nr:patatin-like phospholipase family protein [Deltaproteobacteria bacterium]
MSLRKRKLGLALGGGGARGLSHIGVLQSLEREHIPVDLLVGTSIGALVGGAFCCGLSAIELEQRVAEYLESKEFESSAMKAFETAHGKQDLAFHQKIQRFFKNRYYMVQSLFRPGLLSQEDFQVTINHFIPDISIQETRIPFRAVATDLISGERIVFSEGSMRQALAASCAVPGAVAPLKEGDWLLSDGGIICNIPVSVARQEGADVVIAVPVDRDACSESECETVLGIYFRASEIMACQLQNMELQDADIVIRPNVGNLHWSSFSQARDLISEGGRAVDEKLDEIRSAVFGLKGLLRALPGRIAKAIREW